MTVGLRPANYMNRLKCKDLHSLSVRETKIVSQPPTQVNPYNRSCQTSLEMSPCCAGTPE